MRKGDISISTENIFPIIKKWLYSDCDIFLRELVSNGCDAVTKCKKLAAVGEASLEDGEAFSVEVVLNAEEKTISIIDNGIGMTEDELVQYITQIAFSGAADFLEKYKDAAEDEGGIIGHFGLGFYSAFMVADVVDIHTKSYLPDAGGVFWSCDGGTSYEISEDDRTTRGTEIVLHVGEEHKEFLEEARLRGILEKYCAFLPIPIYMYKAGDERPTESVNDTQPLWLKNPSDCTDEEYKAFYKKVFADFNDPLFYIHLNVEYPFHLQGILYFPKLKHEFEPGEGQIKLYNNQVFIADNIKEVIPEFLLLLKGCIDCPDLPLNVSRSFLQNDGYVSKVSAHITKKVADKLTALYNTERDNYNSYWDDINPFVKYGCLRDEKFYEKVKGCIIYKTTEGRYVSLADYLTDAEAHGHKNQVYYVTDEALQGQYIEMFKGQGLEAVLLPAMIDNHFISMIESKEKDVHFLRIDASVADALKGDDADKGEAVVALFKEAIGDEKLTIEAATLKSEDLPAMITVTEQSRRMQEMMRMYGNGASVPDMFPTEQQLVINLASPVIREIAARAEEKERILPMCLQVYDIARLAQKPLNTEELAAFIRRSGTIMQQALEKNAPTV